MTVKEQVRPENSSQYVNYDEFIDYQLKKTKTGIHHADLLSGVILFGVGITAYLLVFAILDQWIVPGGFSSGVRTILTLLFGLSCVGWIGWKVIWPSMRRVNALYAAREIERAHPEFKSSLMTWVNFRQTGREVPEFIQTSLEKRTATQISKSSIDDAIDRRVLMNSSYLLLGLVVLFCLYTLFSPKRMSTTLWRALMPLSAVSASTRTEIRDIKPGNTEVLARDQVDVIVELGGHIPPEVTLFFSTADRRFINEPVQLRRTDEQRPIFQTRLTGDGGKGLLSDVSYHIVAGDAKSANYEIRVNQPPTADVTAIQYDYPQYMGLARSIQQTNAIDAWEGTWVTVTAQPNMPVKKAILYCSDLETIQDSAEAYPMQIQDDRLTARWQLKFRDDGTFARYFHIQVWNERNQTDPQPTVYRIKIRPDLKPEVAIIHPSEDHTVPANTVVPIGVTARDPDFLLRRVILKRELNGEELPAVTLFNAPPEMADLRSVHKLDLAAAGVQPGDRLSIFAEAEDNFEPFGKRQKNIARSARITLTIAQPAPPQEKQRVEEKQAEELQNKLQADDAANRPREENPEPQPTPAKEKEQSNPQNPPQPQKEGERMPEREMPPEDGAMPKDQQDQSGGSGKANQGTPQQQKKSGGSEGQQGSDQPKGTDQNGMSQGKSGEGSGTGQQQQSGDGPQSPQQSQKQSEQQPGGMNGASDSPTGKEGKPKSEGATSSESNQGSGSSSGKPEQGKAGSRPDKVGEDQALQRLLDWSREQNEKKGESKPDASQSPQDASPSQQNQSGDSQGQTDGATGMKGREEGKQTPSAESNAPPSSTAGEQNRKDGMSGDKSGAADDTKPNQNQGRGNDMPSPDGSDGKGSKPNQGDQKGTSSPTGDRKSEAQGKEENGASQKSGAEGKPDGAKTDKPGEQSSSGEKTGGTNGGEMKTPSNETPMQKETSPAGSSSKSGEDQKSPSPQQQGGAGSDAAAEKKPGTEGMNRPDGENMPRPDANAPSQGQPSQGQPSQGQPTQGQPTQGQPTQGQPTQGQPTQGQPTQGQPTQGQPTQGQPTQGQPTQGQPSQGQPAPDNSGDAGKSASGENAQNKSPNSGGEQNGMNQKEGGTPGSMSPDGDRAKNQPPGQQNSPQGGQQQGGQQQGGQQQGGQQQGGQQQGGQNGMPGGDNSSPGNASNSSQPGPRTTGQGTNQASSSDTSSSAGDDHLMSAEQADLANRKKATELALKRLKEQLERGNSPDSLTKELGYSQEDLEKFMNRLEERLADPGVDKSAETESARRQFESLLKGLTTDSARQLKGGGERERKATQSFGSGNRPVPPEYRRDSEAYQQKLSK